jgi:hypothetical protein
MQHELEVIRAERCHHLLSKGLYLNEGLPKDDHPIGDGNFWCGQTQEIYGPDKGFCNGEACTNKTRTCYETL